MEHKLKILSRYYEAILQGKKTFEVRKDDRPFQEGDTLLLQETVTADGCGYTGREMKVEATYILRDNEYVMAGYCIIGIKIISTNKSRYYNNTTPQRKEGMQMDDYISREKDKTSANAIATLRWNDHSRHKDLLAEFYYHNKYYLTEQMKDAISDAIECLDFADKAQAMLTNEPNVEVKTAAVTCEAEWSYRDDSGNPVPCHCTNCGCMAHTETGNAGCQTITEDILSNFCHNCGARMIRRVI